MKHMRVISYLLRAAAILGIGGCGPITGKHGICTETRTTLGSLDEISALGFSARDMLESALGSHQTTLNWSDGGSTTLTLQVNAVGTAYFIHAELTGDGNTVDGTIVGEGDAGGSVTVTGTDGPAFPPPPSSELHGVPLPPAVCTDRVAADVTVSFVTDDAGFAEAWEVELRSDVPGGAFFEHAVRQIDLVGSYTPAGVDAAELADLTVSVQANFDKIDPGAFSGKAWGNIRPPCITVEEVTTCPGDSIGIASWGPELPPTPL